MASILDAVMEASSVLQTQAEVLARLIVVGMSLRRSGEVIQGEDLSGLCINDGG